MNAKRSAILLSGLLVLMISIAWAQGTGSQDPSCPPLSDKFLQEMLEPSAWARADWNAKTSRWEIDCKQIDAIANMGGSSNDVNTDSSLIDEPISPTANSGKANVNRRKPSRRPTPQ